MHHFKTLLLALLFCTLQSCEKHHPLEASEPFVGESLALGFIPSFDSYLLMQEHSTEKSPVLKHFKIKDKKIEFIDAPFVSYDDNKEAIDGEGLESPQGRIILESQTYPQNYTFFQKALYILKFQILGFKSDAENDPDWQARFFIEEWKTGRKTPKNHFKLDFASILKSYGSFSVWKETLRKQESSHARKVFNNYAADITGLDEYLHYQHYIEQDNQLWMEAILFDAHLEVVDRNQYVLDKSEKHSNLLHAKKNGETIIIRSNVTHDYKMPPQESKKDKETLEDQTTIFTTLHFYVWNPAHSRDPVHLSKEAHHKIEVPRKIRDLHVSFDEANNRFYVAGSWNWRMHQQMGFLMALDENFKTLWTRTFSLENSTTVKGISIGEGNTITLVGECGHSQAITRSTITFQNIMLIKFDRFGTFLDALSFGTDRQEYINEVSSGPHGEILIAGAFDGPITHTADQDDSLGYRFPLALLLPPGTSLLARFQAMIDVRTVTGGSKLTVKKTFRQQDLAIIQNGFNVSTHPLQIEKPESKKLHAKIWKLVTEANEIEDVEESASSTIKITETYKHDIFAGEFDLNYMKGLQAKMSDTIFIPRFYRDFDGYVVADGIRWIRLREKK